MPSRPTRVLVVDDSAFARKVMRECLDAAGLQVVGLAHDGLEALEQIRELAPDVVTLDLVMPNLDGLGVLQALAGRTWPRVVVVTSSEDDSALGIAALQAGAFDVVHKPTGLALPQLYEVGHELVTVVQAAALATPREVTAPLPSSPAVNGASPAYEVVVVGASTGGPQALTRLMASLPVDFPVPLAVVLHIPPGYTAALARRLDEACALEVLEAAEGLPLTRGRVVIARAGLHLKLGRHEGQLVCRLDQFPFPSHHRPSVDALFHSAAEVTGPRTLGVVLTGMGDDGLLGSRAIVAAGGAVLTESERSCVVYGMPRAVVEAGLSTEAVPVEQLAFVLTRCLQGATHGG